MKILVVGGSGYIGSRLIPYLSQWHSVSNYDLTHGEDVRNTPLLRKFCSDKDVVIYLASLSNNDMCNRSQDLARSINQQAFPGVLQIIKDCSVGRFIYASSAAAYGDKENATELNELKPTTKYGEGKAYCEGELKNLAYTEIPYVVTRCASVCGYSPRMRYDLMVNRMIRDAAEKGIIAVNGGEQIRSHIHINDVCRFYRYLLDAKKVEYEAFNVVAENLSVMDTAVRVSRVLGDIKIDVRPYTDNRSYSVSGEKAKEILGFKPLYSVNHAVVENYLNTLYDYRSPG